MLSDFTAMTGSVAMALSTSGAANDTVESGTRIVIMSVVRPKLIMKNIIVMAAITAIYGLVVPVLIDNNIVEKLPPTRASFILELS